jgi:uncharacterized protein (TIGR00288 family)
MTDTTRVAVLIDCDNISHQWAQAILGEIAKHGTLGIKRGYGDWADSHLKSWRPELAKHAIQPVQQFAYSVGKNATDFALVIDAMDLLYSGSVDAFCIVSSDGDFTRLAMRLRESGKRVYGIGARKTPPAFQNACDQFTYVELLVGGDARADDESPVAAAATTATRAAKKAVTKAAPAKKAVKKAAPAKKATTPERSPAQTAGDILLPAVEATADEDGWSPLSAVGAYLSNTNPTFDSRDHGHAKLSSLVRDLPQLQVNEVPIGNGRTTLSVKPATTSRSRKRSRS